MLLVAKRGLYREVARFERRPSPDRHPTVLGGIRSTGSGRRQPPRSRRKGAHSSTQRRTQEACRALPPFPACRKFRRRSSGPRLDPAKLPSSCGNRVAGPTRALGCAVRSTVRSAGCPRAAGVVDGVGNRCEFLERCGQRRAHRTEGGLGGIQCRALTLGRGASHEWAKTVNQVLDPRGSRLVESLSFGVAGEVVGENLDRSGGRLESLMECTVGIGGVRDRLAKMADPVPGGVDLLTAPATWRASRSVAAEKSGSPGPTPGTSATSTVTGPASTIGSWPLVSEPTQRRRRRTARETLPARSPTARRRPAWQARPARSPVPRRSQATRWSPAVVGAARRRTTPPS